MPGWKPTLRLASAAKPNRQLEVILVGDSPDVNDLIVLRRWRHLLVPLGRSKVPAIDLHRSALDAVGIADQQASYEKRQVTNKQI